MTGYNILTVFLCIVVAVSQVSSAVQYQKCAENWLKKGCRVDDDKGLITLFDDRKDGQRQIDWDNLHGYILDLACRCRAKAIKLNYQFFALENYGICFSAPGPIENFLGRYPLAPPNSCIGALKHNKSIVSDVDGEVCFGGVMRAYFYKILKRNAPIGGDAGDGDKEEAACPKVSDVVLLVDVSGSVGEENFKRVQEFLQKLIDRFDFGSGQSKSRLCIVTFDDKYYTYLTWLDSQAVSKAQIRDIINSINYTGGSTATDKAIKHVIKTVIKPFKRANVPKTVFIITDGRCHRGSENLPGPSAQLKALGCNVITIGIGETIDNDELLMLTGNKTGNILLYSSFKNLLDRAAVVINEMVKKACL